MSTIEGVARKAAGVLLARARDVTTGGPAATGRRLARALESMLLPPVCCLCGGAGRSAAFDLCDVCATLLPVFAGEARSDFPLGDGPLVGALFLFKYEYPVDYFVRALKFRGERVFARVLGELLAREHRARGMELPACIVPMPLHDSRYRERGFNQAREIARFAARSLGVCVDSRLLARRRVTREQSGLTLRARRENVKGAFEVAGALPRGRIALIDDVVTTGSTALAAARALAAGGADEVELWAVARVQKEHE